MKIIAGDPEARAPTMTLVAAFTARPSQYAPNV
jgi:hypothetical protein